MMRSEAAHHRTSGAVIAAPVKAALVVAALMLAVLIVATAAWSRGADSGHAVTDKPRSSGAAAGGARLRTPVGTNLAPICDWSVQRPFADLFKQSRPWISHSEGVWDDGRTVDVDARGWVRSLAPGQRARSLVIWGTPAPAGELTITWQGDGALDFWPQEVVRSERGRAIIRVDPRRGGVAVTITRTDPLDPVRDIHVWPAGLEGQLFHSRFLESLRPYAVLRFMDWAMTNESTTVSWQERARLDDARWTVKGVPLEVMVELANAVDADPWLTLPHTWDDDAVAQAAALVHARLPERRRVWIERSNEVWNGMFPQADHARRAGVARRRAQDPFEAQLREHAAQSAALFAPWERAFARTPHRLVRVLASMAANPWVSAVMLQDQDLLRHVDVLAIAPYIGGRLGAPERAAATRAMSPDDLLRALDQSIVEAMAHVRAHRDLAARHGLPLVAYEGGQHLVGVGPAAHDEALTALFHAANRDPRMRTVYLDYLAAWREAGGTLFVHYLDAAAPSSHGAWGARTGLDEPRAAAPKWDALLTFVEHTPVWWER